MRDLTYFTLNRIRRALARRILSKNRTPKNSRKRMTRPDNEVFLYPLIYFESPYSIYKVYVKL